MSQPQRRRGGPVVGSCAMPGFRAMSSRVVVASVALLAGAIVFAAESGCGDDPAATVRTSRRGELCTVTNDCGEGLSCAPLPGGFGGGICVTGQFRVPVSAKECALVECTSAADCCDEALVAGCAELRFLCLADAGTGSAQACLQYESQCGCASGKIDCELGKCVSHCITDGDCDFGGSGRRCAGGACVQCAVDADCASTGRQCVTGQCHSPCSSDGDCGGFDRCVASRCIASGCQSDRECVAGTRNVDARCGTDGKCVVPCETDLECGNPTSYSFFSCIEKQCTYVGCDSDKDCRLFYTGVSDASTLPAKQHVVCRDPGIVGTVVKPGQ